ncbi:hypothetical protein EMIT0194MI4_20249 [Pseudomonas sp. IT-194MI4]
MLTEQGLSLIENNKNGYPETSHVCTGPSIQQQPRRFHYRRRTRIPRFCPGHRQVHGPRFRGWRL